MRTHLLSIAVIVDRIVEVIADDQNKPPDHQSVQNLIHVILRVGVGIFVAGLGVQSLQNERSS